MMRTCDTTCRPLSSVEFTVIELLEGGLSARGEWRPECEEPDAECSSIDMAFAAIEKSELDVTFEIREIRRDDCQ